jgi:hypothetical protein
MPWLCHVDGVLETYLGDLASDWAIADILLGNVN